MEKLKYSDIRDKSSRVLGLTGLKPEEFEALLKDFIPFWEKFIKHYTLEGKRRKRQVLKERKNAMLPTIADKLLFILYEHKNHPTQEVLATQFDMEQPHANMWLKTLRPLLEQTLSANGDLPVRRASELNKAIGERKSVVIDGVERPVLRSGDAEMQAEEFSGKKRHCVKNVLIAGTDQKIIYLSETYPGSVHDKTIADEQDIEFQRTIELLQDTGFQGYKPKNADIIQPMKKPKGKELTDDQKKSNTAKSKVRVVVEHSIRGFKIWRIAKDVCRTWRVDLRDYCILIACGLHNFRLRKRGKIKP